MDLQYNKTDSVVLPITNTRISASEYNQIAGSLMQIITSAGLTPDGGDNTQLLNAVKSFIGRTVIETYSNGTSWYRIYSDGWCEQGGRYTVTSSSPHTIDLFKTMANTDYSIMICPGLNNAGDNTLNIHVRTDMITTTSFGIQKQWSSYSGYYYWEVKGYIDTTAE